MFCTTVRYLSQTGFSAAQFSIVGSVCVIPLQNDRQVALIIEHLDKDGDGEISTEEFMTLVFEGQRNAIRKKFQTAAYTQGGQDFAKLFHQYDREHSGEMSFSQFSQVVSCQFPAVR